MATIQLTGLPAIGVAPAVGDLLLIRSAGVDYKVDYDDLVPVRDDTNNAFTGTNSFAGLSTFDGNIDVDTIGSISASGINITDTLKVDTVNGQSGTVVNFLGEIDVDSTATFTDDVNIETTGSGTKALFASDNVNPTILPQAIEGTKGALAVATQTEVDDYTTTNDTDAVTPEKLRLSPANLKLLSNETLGIQATVDFSSIPTTAKYIKILLNDVVMESGSTTDYVSFYVGGSGVYVTASAAYLGRFRLLGGASRDWSAYNGGLVCYNNALSGENFHGEFEFSRVDDTSNHWIVKTNVFCPTSGNIQVSVGRVQADVVNLIDMVRLFSTTGKNFESGNISLWYC